jgi:putative FmdB family regulatory protein
LPLYEYRCSKCGDKFEVIQKFADTPLTQHEGCGGSVERLISAPGLHFKGSGWYITDYARGGSSQKKDSDGESSKSKTESKSSESKGSESKSGESKSTESKSSETKSSETKSESKPASSTKND